MTQGMDQMLAGFFGTGGEAAAQPTGEDAEKVAQAEFFAKTAAANGINLDKLNDAQIEWLWNKTFSKEAGALAGQSKEAEFPPHKDEHEGDDKEKKEREGEARKEHEEKKAAAERFEQATYFGKTAAHAYVAEMKNIIGAGGLDFMKEAGLKEHAGRASAAVGRHMERTGNKLVGAQGNLGKLSPGHAKAVGAAAHGAGAAAAAGAAAGIHHATKEKKSSAFELEAAQLAFNKVAEANFDQTEAETRLNAVLTLGLNDSEKVASLEKYEDALERRSLEYAAAAGYPVEWT